ncbi:hypothetical protein [Pseudactinotalea sp.]|uniref:hypothetical protein n=1 Tax=Pseudactinotalea sp. TaxID=1926260 RepID=UPI003B3A05AE
MTALRAVARWWVPALPRARVAWVRAALALMAVIDTRYFLNSTDDRAGTPEFFQPVVAARWLHLPPVTDEIASMLLVGVHLGAVAVVVGGFARVPALVQNLGGVLLGISFLLWALWGMSYGYVAHDHMAITVGLVLLMTAGTARYGGGEAADIAAGWPLRMIQVLTVMTYFGSVLAKYAISGGSLIRWGNSGTLAWAFIRRPNDLNQMIVTHGGLLRAAQWGGLVLELCSPLVFLLRRHWLMLAIGAFLSFHLVTFLLLGIHFLPTVICWTAFVPFERLPAWVRERRTGAVVAAPAGEAAA